MHIKNKNASKTLMLTILSSIALLALLSPAFAAAESDIFETVLTSLSFIGNLITIAAITISEFYFSYIHGSVVSLISSVWPESWPQYPIMLATYQNLFYKIPLWFTGNFWPTSWFGSFPLWGIDLFLATEIFYIALRLVTTKSKPFEGSWLSRFLKSTVYETWVFIKAPFYAAFSVILFLIRSEKEKRRTLLFWLYSLILFAIVIGVVLWFAQY